MADMCCSIESLYEIHRNAVQNILKTRGHHVHQLLWHCRTMTLFSSLAWIIWQEQSFDAYSALQIPHEKNDQNKFMLHGGHATGRVLVGIRWM